MSSRFLARFPFLDQAASYVREKGIVLPDLLSEVVYEEARERGRQRVLDALEGREIVERSMGTDLEQMHEILSYPLARMLVSCVADGFLIRRYALAEGVTMNRRLQEEDPESVLLVARQLGVRAAIVESALRMHFTDYLRFTSRMRSKEWKLVNTEVRAGFVFLPKTKFCRVMQQALQDRLEEELPLPVSEKIIEALKPDARRMRELVDVWRERYKAEDLGRISIVKFPPCMKRLVAIAQAGENMPHTGRFALTAFLHFIGLSPEEILNLFSASPDFDPAKSRYQIEHITGEISGTEYTPPECSTMRSYGLCVDQDDLCRHPKVSHPLTYYRIKSRRKKPKPEEQKEPEEGER
jgi:DNA primase large subunit